MLEIDYALWPLFGDHIGTLWIQLASFLVLLFILNIILYKPIRGVLAKRDEETNSLQRTIEDYLSRSEQNENIIEEAKVQARKEGSAEKENLKGQGIEEEKGILQEAASSAEEKVGIAKKEIEMKIADVQKSLEDQLAVFSNELAEKVLGRSI
jgi:F-type H+-transporting ATPase subunit b